LLLENLQIHLVQPQQVHTWHRDCKGNILGADLEELVTRSPGRPMAQEINISRNNCKNDGV
jgi:hypothetical protein